jgi:hypothetical protein
MTKVGEHYDGDVMEFEEGADPEKIRRELMEETLKPFKELAKKYTVIIPPAIEAGPRMWPPISAHRKAPFIIDYVLDFPRKKA